MSTKPAAKTVADTDAGKKTVEESPEARDLRIVNAATPDQVRSAGIQNGMQVSVMAQRLRAVGVGLE